MSSSSSNPNDNHNGVQGTADDLRRLHREWSVARSAFEQHDKDFVTQPLRAHAQHKTAAVRHAQLKRSVEHERSVNDDLRRIVSALQCEVDDEREAQEKRARLFEVEASADADADAVVCVDVDVDSSAVVRRQKARAKSEPRVHAAAQRSITLSDVNVQCDVCIARLTSEVERSAKALRSESKALRASTRCARSCLHCGAPIELTCKICDKPQSRSNICVELNHGISSGYGNCLKKKLFKKTRMFSWQSKGG